MDEKRYLKDVKADLFCSSAKRKEVLQKLQEEIAEAEKNGQSFEEWMEENGKPEELAKRLNRNMSPEEKRIAKREKFFFNMALTVGFFGLSLLAVFGIMPKSHDLSKSEVFSEEEVTRLAKEVIQCLDANDYEGLQPYLTEDMKEAVTPQALDEIKKQVAENFGEFKAWGKSSATEMAQKGKLYAVIEMPVSYENTDMIYRLSFDENMLLSGLYMQ